MIKRRITDKCIAKRIWEWATPYAQIGGYLIMLGTIITGLWASFSFIKQASDAVAAVGDLQQFRSKTETSLAVVQQEVHDMHEFLLGRSHR